MHVYEFTYLYDTVILAFLFMIPLYLRLVKTVKKSICVCERVILGHNRLSV